MRYYTNSGSLMTLYSGHANFVRPGTVSPFLVTTVCYSRLISFTDVFTPRDIKTSNILLACSVPSSSDAEDGIQWETVDTSKLTLKLCDFGVSRSFNEIRQSGQTLTVVGTEKMMAPEIRDAYINMSPTAKYTSKADIWSCGLLAYLAFKRSLPSKYPLSKSPCLQGCSIYHLQILTDLPGYSNDSLANDASLDVGGFKQFLMRQIVKDADSRATAEELLKMEFLTHVPSQ